ncbi:hypothetical protein CLOM_g2713, partial [Closterium sp. NIES-68]
LFRDVIECCELATDICESLIGIPSEKSFDLLNRASRIQSLLVEDLFEYEQNQNEEDVARSLAHLDTVAEQVKKALCELIKAHWKTIPQSSRYQKLQDSVTTLEASAIQLALSQTCSRSNVLADSSARSDRDSLLLSTLPLQLLPVDDWDDIMPWQPASMEPKVPSAPESENGTPVRPHPPSLNPTPCPDSPTSCKANPVGNDMTSCDFRSAIIPRELYPQPVFTRRVRLNA